MMENITYDVRIWKTEVYRGTKLTTYTVRWKVGDRAWKQAFRVRAQADSFQAELHAAARKGEAFDTTTGRPVSWGRATKGSRANNVWSGLIRSLLLWYGITCGC